MDFLWLWVGDLCVPRLVMPRMSDEGLTLGLVTSHFQCACLTVKGGTWLT